MDAVSARRVLRWAGATTLALALGSIATTASAAEPADAKVGARNDPAAAEALFREGRKLMTAGKLDDACNRFDESYRLDPAPGTLLNVAECARRRGKTATAWGQFLEAARVFRRRNEERRAQFADQEAKKLEPLLAHLVVRADEPPADLVVARDGAEIGSTSLGLKLPIDPGNVLVEARAKGRKPYSTKVAVADKKTVEVRIPKLEVEPEPVVAPASPSATRPESNGGDGMRIASFVVGGVGLASLAVGGAFVGLTASQAGELELLCPSNTCATAEARDALASANLYANVANATLIAGSVLAATGIALFVFAPDEPDSLENDGADPVVSSFVVRPYVTPMSAGLLGHF